MSETAWLPALTVLGSGVLVGSVLAWWAYRRRAAQARTAGGRGDAKPIEQLLAGGRAAPVAGQDTGAEFEDLCQRRDELIAELRELEDHDTTRASVAMAEERATLEREAAQVLREIHRLEAQRAARAGTKQSAPAPQGLRSPMLRGALIGGGTVAFVALVSLWVFKTAQPRGDGMPPTASSAQQPATSGNAADEAHAAGAGAARPIVARETEQLKQARVRLEEQPDSLEALVAYGYAVADAGGWIEAFQTAQKILARDKEHPDGLIQMAIVRAAMGEDDAAGELLHHVLAKNPNDVRVLEIKGRIALRRGDVQDAISLWEQAKKHGGDAAIFDSLIATAKQAPPADGQSSTGPGSTGPGGAGQLPPGHPPIDEAHPAGETPPAGQGLAAGETISGTIRLADGAIVPQGAVLYIMLRAAEDRQGTPLAVKRVVASQFPLAFAIGPANAMMGDALPTSLALSVRVDADSNVGTRQPADLAGEVQEPLKLGARNVDVVLHQPR